MNKDKQTTKSHTPRVSPGRLQRTSHPLVYEVNTRVLLNELSTDAGKRVTLATIPDSVLDEWADLCFDAIWLMGVWTTGTIGEEMARTHPGLAGEYRKVLPDLKEEDIFSSPYAVKSYMVAPSLGGNKSLLVLRKRMEQRGMGLFLDFVCNHTARDHKWVKTRPDYYINVDPATAREQRDSFFVTETAMGERGIAFGKDPYFPGWTDTGQLNFDHQGMRQALIHELLKIAELCDGVRCDMAMLVLDEVFTKTWGTLAGTNEGVHATGEFWREAIDAVRSVHPKWMFIAEAYWDLEWPLQQLGFDYTYDKRLYDRLLREGASSVYDYLKAEKDYQQRSLRFIENHDEPRAARVLSNEAWHVAAATAMATVPGMALFHEGQLDGRTAKLPVQLARRPDEKPAVQIRRFYEKLISSVACPIIQHGEWSLLDIRPAWQGNESWRNFLAHLWQRGTDEARLIVINYAPLNSQCYIGLSLEKTSGVTIEFRDLMSTATYTRERQALLSKGLFFDLPPYGLHMFDVRPVHK
ncbi:MAG: alpha-amylase family glycosyl hydrolase [Bacteroidota bacterium]